MSKIYTSADQLIGRTPLLELTRIERWFDPVSYTHLTLPTNSLV